MYFYTLCMFYPEFGIIVTLILQESSLKEFIHK